MTNQASEDELLKTLLDKLAIIKYGEAYKWLFDVDKSNVDMWTKDLLAIVRTEKLKLLDRLSSHQEDLFWWTGGGYEKTKAVDMRAIQAERAKLEEVK